MRSLSSQQNCEEVAVDNDWRIGRKRGREEGAIPLRLPDVSSRSLTRWL